MRSIITMILFIGVMNLYGQEEVPIKVNSIEDATNLALVKTRELISDKNDRVIISYEYVYNTDNIMLEQNDYVKAYEYDMNDLKKGEYVYILKVLINVDKEVYVNSLLFKCTKKSKKDLELTYIQSDTNTYIVK